MSSPLPPSEPRETSHQPQSTGAGVGIYYFGTVVWILGVVLIIGNVSRLLPTFAYAGFLVTLVGFIIQSIGNSVTKNSYQPNPLFDKAAILLADPNYKVAKDIVLADLKNQVDDNHLLDRAVFYLEQAGVPSAEARANLGTIFSALVLAARYEDNTQKS